MSTFINTIKQAFTYGDHPISIETGGIARQANAAVWVRMGDTVVQVTVVSPEQTQLDSNYFPLSVSYQEPSYAAGRIPGGYFKREMRPTEREILISRLIDRPLRPLFPSNFYREVQVIAKVLSIDPQIDADIPALIGASAALTLSGLPFQGPIGVARVGYIQSGYVLNPSTKQLLRSKLDLVVAGTQHATLMVESQANELSEEVMLGAIQFGQQQLQVVIENIKMLAEKAGKSSITWQHETNSTSLEMDKINLLTEQLSHIYQIEEKTQRKSQLSALLQRIQQDCINADKGIDAAMIGKIFSDIERKVVRDMILTKGKRIDGRDHQSIRPINVQTSVLPRTHGSAIFTRGETQALVITTLGTDRDAQMVETSEGEARETFLLHYLFPPYSVGETGTISGPKRREIGHGNLAKRALRAVLPSEEEFPHVLRVVSEITESNGSSSMATVCGASLALMDAAVPIKKPVAGIAMGLIKEAENSVILSDILGDEDHLGDMDFKVAGTQDGITALQMDIKIAGITHEIFELALKQAKEGRLYILDIMNQELAKARVDASPYAPQIVTIKIKPEKIANLIGKAGSVIRSITEETGCLIDISDDGLVRISTTSAIAAQKAIERVKRATADVEVDAIYAGTVIKITDFGAFVSLLPGRDGLVHISQISSDERIERVTDKLHVGDAVNVKVLEVDRQGRVRLTMRGVDQNTSSIKQEEVS